MEVGTISSMDWWVNQVQKNPWRYIWKNVFCILQLATCKKTLSCNASYPQNIKMENRQLFKFEYESKRSIKLSEYNLKWNFFYVGPATGSFVYSAYYIHVILIFQYFSNQPFFFLFCSAMHAASCFSLYFLQPNLTKPYLT